MNEVNCQAVVIVAVRDAKAPRVPFARTECNYVTHSKNIKMAKSCASADCRNDRSSNSIKPTRLG